MKGYRREGRKEEKYEFEGRGDWKYLQGECESDKTREGNSSASGYEDDYLREGFGDGTPRAAHDNFGGSNPGIGSTSLSDSLKQLQKKTQKQQQAQNVNKAKSNASESPSGRSKQMAPPIV